MSPDGTQNRAARRRKQAEGHREQDRVHGLRQEQLREPLDVRNHLAPHRDDARQSREGAIEEDELRDGTRSRRPRSHRDSEIRVLQRQRVVDPVTDHRDGAAERSQRDHHGLLLLRCHPAEEPLGAEHLGEALRIAGQGAGVDAPEGRRQSHRVRHRCHRPRFVAGHDAHLDAFLSEVAHDPGRIVANALVQDEHGHRSQTAGQTRRARPAARGDRLT
jgi:hypothetical protein